MTNIPSGFMEKPCIISNQIPTAIGQISLQVLWNKPAYFQIKSPQLLNAKPFRIHVDFIHKFMHILGKSTLDLHEKRLL